MINVHIIDWHRQSNTDSEVMLVIQNVRHYDRQLEDVSEAHPLVMHTLLPCIWESRRLEAFDYNVFFFDMHTSISPIDEETSKHLAPYCQATA